MPFALAHKAHLAPGEGAGGGRPRGFPAGVTLRCFTTQGLAKAVPDEVQCINLECVS